GYPMRSALAFVGDHHQLEARQRKALSRGVCSEVQRRERTARRLSLDAMRGASIAIDGFNLLVTLEVALSGGLIVIGRDGAARDLAGLRGSYHVVPETELALDRIATLFAHHRPASVTWFFDAPVSSSGSLRANVEGRSWPVKTEARLVPSADHALVSAPHVVSADAAVLDACESWHEVAGPLVDEISLARVVSLWSEQ
ncbi:MAG: DUF434 domain-containing protein, partial [Polyangiales bacterium]